MSRGEFRFAYFTPRYEETLAFYRDGLGLAVVGRWDRGADDRGTLFAAAAGIVEVLARPAGPSSHLWDDRPPQGAMMVIEVPDVAALYLRAVERGLAVTQPLQEQSWGHTSFCLREPNGLTLYLFAPQPGER